MCEKCWQDAANVAYLLGVSQVEGYEMLRASRTGYPCSPEEQRGERPEFPAEPVPGPIPDSEIARG